MVSKPYYLLFKSAQAERRAWKNLDEKRKKVIFPIVELTRGRKNPARKKEDGTKITIPDEELLTTLGAYGFDSNCQKTIELMSSCDEFILDITREPSLGCQEITELSLPKNGYENWVSYLSNLGDAGTNLIPTILVNPGNDDDEEKYVADLNSQIEAFSRIFRGVSYRISVLYDTEFMYDIDVFKELINAQIERGQVFYVVLDHEYIRPNGGQHHADRTSEIIDLIKDKIPKAKFISVATSFPKNVTDVGEEDFGIFPVEEMKLYEALKAKHNDLLYGDYGSINPIRNDAVIITQGWRPRIDFVSNIENDMQTYYFREQRKVIGSKTVPDKKKSGTKEEKIRAPYSTHYTSVANSVSQYKLYEELNLSWGNGEILSAQRGSVPSNSPSHWISVRMEIHMIQVLRKLDCDPLSGK